MNIKKVKYLGKDIVLQIRDSVDNSVAAEIFKHREYRRAETAISEAKIVIIDVGAHAGYFTIYCRAINPIVKVLALEPEPENYQFLLENIRLNKIENVEPLELALSGISGEADLLISGDSHNHSLSGNDMLVTGKSIKVKTCSLSDLAERYKLKKIDLIKMDIEGEEYNVISKLSDNDFSIVSAFIFEYHNFGARNHKIIEKILRENHFGVEIFPSKFDKKMGFIFARNKLLKRN
ncbi:MAG: FkbM family methyltransferase [Candidatus Magasanikbacteria bacterium]|nr:FkbM family methyltransferase [Candidatus Magasanikbacteria bacterium]